MIEFGKMRSEEFYDFTSEECVLVKDIPSDSMAVGNPCRVLKSIK